MRRRTVRSVVALSLATTFLASEVHAQEASVVPFPVRAYADENGVDLISGKFTAYSPGIRIGSDEMGLGYLREVRGAFYRDTMMGTIGISGSTYTVDIAGRSEAFTLAGGVFTPVEQIGSTLTLSGSVYTYTRSDGSFATFSTATYWTGNSSGISIASLTYPSGRSLTFHYTIAGYTDSTGVARQGRRLQSVTTNAGYHMKLSYQSDTLTSSSLGPWTRITRVKGLNSATDPCGVTDSSCPQTGRPELIIEPPVNTGTPQSGFTTQNYTDGEGRTTVYTLTGSVGQRQVTGIRLPGSTADDISVVYSGGRVSSISRSGVTTGYTSADLNGIRTVTVARPGGATRVVTFDINKSLLLTDRDELNRTVTYQYDANNRPSRVMLPEGNYVRVTRDSRGNVTEQRSVAKPGSGQSDIVTTASFPPSCANGVTCNSPTSTTDARGNVTDYTYDPAHGGVLTVTAPAPSAGAVRPQTRVSYTRLGAGGAPDAGGIFRVTAVSTCQTGAAPACVGTADEAKTTVAWTHGLLPSTITSGAGDGSLEARETRGYDAVGNLITLDGPLTGTADTVRYRYNLNREAIGTVGPDPDGAGPLKHRAQRLTIDARGLPTRSETGTVVSQGDADWAAFQPLQESRQDYDAWRRPTVQRLIAAGTTHALTQVSYDSRSRTECVATRMNPAAFGSLPASACTLGPEGTSGPDRIARSVYDGAGQVLQQQVAVGTAAQATEATLTYTDNGQTATLTDGENNRTTYVYDGHDRLSETRHPVSTKGANASSTTDFEGLTWDAAGNVVSTRLRDGQLIGATYDALNRLTLKNLPGSEPDVSYGYDLLGRLTSASQTGASLSFSYDALGRNLTQAGPQGTVTSAYDLSGRRTRLTYPGSELYLDYDYLVTGEMTRIRENGATTAIGVLATFAHDDLGRRTSLTFGNGTYQTYGWDAVSRLTSQSINLAGSADDLTISIPGYNPAGQITVQTRSNDAYAFRRFPPGGSRPYTSNGLNQYTQSGGVHPTYDARGNLVTSGPTAFTYSSENMLLSRTEPGEPNVTLSWDPLLRLREVQGAATARFGYDGLDLILEQDGAGATLRRFVFAPGWDQPIVQYEGNGTLTRRFLHADERGSIAAISNADGTVLAKNTYDEYGFPGLGNNLAPRFGYTGQVWLPEIGLYHYKARMYSPGLGRFLQTDPIGTADQVNLYAYVRNDPVNSTDPTGLLLNIVAGAAVSATLSYGAQVVRNYANGQTGVEAFSNVDVKMIAVDAAFGAAGLGLARAAYVGKASIVPGQVFNLNKSERIAAGFLGAVAPGTKTFIYFATHPGLNLGNFLDPYRYIFLFEDERETIGYGVDVGSQP